MNNEVQLESLLAKFKFICLLPSTLGSHCEE